MAIRVAISDGVWSSGSTWEDGIVPTSSDDVYFVGKNVILDQNITVNSLRGSTVFAPTWTPFAATTTYQMVPSSSIPLMTSNTTPIGTGIATASTNNASAYQAFDRNAGATSTGWTGAANGGWLGFFFDTGKIIKRYVYRNFNQAANCPYSWTFEGSNDAVSWTVLDTVTNYPQSANNFYTSSVLANTSSYTKYRINVSAVQTSGSTLIISKLEMTESTYPVYVTNTSFIGEGTLVFPPGFTINATSDIQGYRSPSNTGFIIYSASAPGVANINCPNIYGGGSTDSSYGIIHSGTGTLNISGNIVASPFNGGGAGSVGVTGTGILNVTGDIKTWTTNPNCHGLRLVSTCTVNIKGDVIFQTATGGRIALYITAGAPTVNITGSVYGIPPATNGTAPIQISSVSTPTINISGSVSASLCTPIYITNSGGSNLNIIGDLIGTPVNTAVINSANQYVNLNHTGSIISTGTAPVIYCPANASVIINTTATSLVNQINGGVLIIGWKIFFSGSTGRTWTFRKEDGVTTASLYSSDLITSSGQPSQSDVRLGTSYGAGAYIGTCAVPSPLSVAYPIEVDNTRGVAVLTADSVGAAIWDRLAGLLVTTGSIGERLKNTATVQTTGAQIAGFDI